MTSEVKRLILVLLRPKAIFLGAAIFLFIYVLDNERRIEAIVGCHVCGWDTSQAFLLPIAATALLIGRFWGLVISLLASLKVIYSIGYLALWSNFAEARGLWHIWKASLNWTFETHPEYFAEILLAVLIALYAARFLWQPVSRKYLSNSDGI
jgi:hypothetical protein